VAGADQVDLRELSEHLDTSAMAVGPECVSEDDGRAPLTPLLEETVPREQDTSAVGLDEDEAVVLGLAGVVPGSQGVLAPLLGLAIQEGPADGHTLGVETHHAKACGMLDDLPEGLMAPHNGILVLHEVGKPADVIIVVVGRDHGINALESIAFAELGDRVEHETLDLPWFAPGLSNTEVKPVGRAVVDEEARARVGEEAVEGAASVRHLDQMGSDRLGTEPAVHLRRLVYRLHEPLEALDQLLQLGYRVSEGLAMGRAHQIRRLAYEVADREVSLHQALPAAVGVLRVVQCVEATAVAQQVSDEGHSLAVDLHEEALGAPGVAGRGEDPQLVVAPGVSRVVLEAFRHRHGFDEAVVGRAVVVGVVHAARQPVQLGILEQVPLVLGHE